MTVDGITADVARTDVEAPKLANEQRRKRQRLGIIGLTGAVLVLGGLLVWHADRTVNHVPLAALPRAVSVVSATARTYRAHREYVGTLEAWIEANIGPQFVSAYVETVLVRPGAVVRRGEVLATLDCSNASALSRAIAMRARSVEQRQRALSDEAARKQGLLGGGFVAANEVEQTTARSSAEQSRLLETRAELSAASLQVNDCIMRAPFDGEVATRSLDPGAFARPGATIVSIVDRATVRVTADAPERDFTLVAPSTPVSIQMLSTGQRLTAAISRRAPKADPHTRTVHIEIDVNDPKRELPVGTTGLVRVESGKATETTEIPLYAAVMRSEKATLFVVERSIAHERTVPTIGEDGGKLYVDRKALLPGTLVVTEGRALLSDGDRVQAHAQQPPFALPSSSPTRGGGFGRPL